MQWFNSFQSIFWKIIAQITKALFPLSLFITPCYKMKPRKVPYQGQLLIFFSMCLLSEETEPRLSIYGGLRQRQIASSALWTHTSHLAFKVALSWSLLIRLAHSSGCSSVIKKWDVGYTTEILAWWTANTIAQQRLSSNSYYAFP